MAKLWRFITCLWATLGLSSALKVTQNTVETTKTDPGLLELDSVVEPESVVEADPGATAFKVSKGAYEAAEAELEGLEAIKADAAAATASISSYMKTNQALKKWTLGMFLLSAFFTFFGAMGNPGVNSWIDSGLTGGAPAFLIGLMGGLGCYVNHYVQKLIVLKEKECDQICHNQAGTKLLTTWSAFTFAGMAGGVFANVFKPIYLPPGAITIETDKTFNITAYKEYAWYPLYMTETYWQKKNAFDCTSAMYEWRNKPESWWDVDVTNTKLGKSSKICARVQEYNKLVVAPCWMPYWMGSPYWVAHYDEDKGVALVLGGQPTKEVNGKFEMWFPDLNGMWILSRYREGNDANAEEVLEMMKSEFKINTKPLSKVDHTNCTARLIETGITDIH